MRTFVVAALVLAAVGVCVHGAAAAAAVVTERAVVRATTAAHDAARDLEAATLAFQSAWAAPGPGPITTAANGVTTRASGLVTGMRTAVGAKYMPQAIEAMGVVMKFVTSATDVSTSATMVHASEQMFATLLLMNARNLLTLLPATLPPSAIAATGAAAAPSGVAPGAVAPRFMALDDENEEEEQEDEEEEEDVEADDEEEELAFMEVGGPWSDVRDQAVSAQAAAAAIAPLVSRRLTDVTAAATVLVTKATSVLQATQTVAALWNAYTQSAQTKGAGAAGVAASMGGVSAASAVLTATQALSVAQQLAGAVTNPTTGWPSVLPKCPVAVAAGDNAVKAIAAIARTNP